MIHVALVEPEIAPNTGNIARLCAATNTRLHLIGRLGFQIHDRAVKRAGLDYWNEVKLDRYIDWTDFNENREAGRIIAISKHGSGNYTQFRYQPGDYLIFGSETRGLPEQIREHDSDACLYIPMFNENVRCLNLSTSVGIVLYEALRQIHAW